MSRRVLLTGIIVLLAALVLIHPDTIQSLRSLPRAAVRLSHNRLAPLQALVCPSPPRPTPPARTMSSGTFGIERWDPNGSELILKPPRSTADPRSLKGKRVLVIGGSGSVGSHQVEGFAKAGAEVLLASRKLANAEAAAKAASSRVPDAKIIPVAGDLGTFDGAAKFADKVIKEHGTVDHVVVAIGSWWSGRGLWDVPPDVWQKFFVDVTTGYIASLHAWLPRLPESGAMVWILGASGVVPVPGAGPLSMAQASLVMAQRVVEAETGASRRLFSIVLGNLATRERPGAPSSWISADEAAEVAVALAARTDAPSQGVVIRHRAALDSVQKRLGLK